MFKYIVSLIKEDESKDQQKYLLNFFNNLGAFEKSLFAIILLGLTASIPFLVKQSYKKIKRIQDNESYCTISVYNNILTSFNLVFQAVSNIYTVFVIINIKFFNVIVFIVLWESLFAVCLLQILLQTYEWFAMLIVILVQKN